MLSNLDIKPQIAKYMVLPTLSLAKWETNTLFGFFMDPWFLGIEGINDPKEKTFPESFTTLSILSQMEECFEIIYFEWVSFFSQVFFHDTVDFHTCLWLTINFSYSVWSCFDLLISQQRVNCEA